MDTCKLSTSSRTQKNVYILDEGKEEKCCMGQMDENWLWNKIIGHINFDNLFKIRKWQSVRDIPKITKPSKYVFKHFLHGKKTRVSIKSKEYSRTKPLELVHTDLCGPIRTKGLNGESYFLLFIDDHTRMTRFFFLNKN